MIQLKTISKGIFFLIIGMLPFTVMAESSMDFGSYTVHFNAFRSDTLTPEIAKSYQLTRRNNRMVVNISVRKRDDKGGSKPVKAKVSGFASNMSLQVKNLEFREIPDGGAIYYLAQSQVSNRETLKFDIKVTPEGETITANVKFKKKFFTD